MACILVALLMLARKEQLVPRDGSWRPGILVGILFALEFLFIGEALRFTSASHTVVFLYTAPIFAALGLHLKLPDERLGRMQWAGIAVSFAGILAAFYGRDSQGEGSVAGKGLLGDCLALLAGLSWGATTVVIRCTRLSGAPATRTLFYQLAGAFAILIFAAFATGQIGFRGTPMVWASLIFQGVIVSFASFLVWFWLLRKYLASRLGTLSFMSPLFGVAFAVWLLDEPLDIAFLAGSLLVLAGIFLVTRAERRPVIGD
jgi:drug/metabolite transporter (DMT)-like permease